jgi:hypothetical protein
MKRRTFVTVLVAAAGFAAMTESLPSSAAGHPKGEAPTVGSVSPMLEGFRWGMTRAEVVTAHNQVGGIFDKEYDPILAKTQPGIQQKVLEADRDNRKAAFQNSWVEFRDTPTGYDSMGIHGEYTYRNNEALLWVERTGKKRYFFFIGAKPSERLWKIYDEIPLAEGGALGKTFLEAATKLNAALGVAGRVLAADPSQGRNYTTVDWQDANTHVRALDRGRVVAVVLEDKNTLNNLTSLRANKEQDPFAMDPSITAVTRGGISDPNAHGPAPAASGTPKKK